MWQGGCSAGVSNVVSEQRVGFDPPLELLDCLEGLALCLLGRPGAGRGARGAGRSRGGLLAAFDVQKMSLRAQAAIDRSSTRWHQRLGADRTCGGCHQQEPQQQHGQQLATGGGHLGSVVAGGDL